MKSKNQNKNPKRVTLITGHYGSGKSNLAVNLAVDIRKAGNQCLIADLDIVNPYFRSADFTRLFGELGIELAVSKYANSNLDIPSLSFGLSSISDSPKHAVIDVGGDDAGAFALGRYSEILNTLRLNGELEMIYVINKYRYLTKEPEEALSLMREIERASGLACTGIVNNSNLGSETENAVIKNSVPYAEEVARIARLPLLFTAGKKGMGDGVENYYPIEIYVKAPWGGA